MADQLLTLNLSISFRKLLKMCAAVQKMTCVGCVIKKTNNRKENNKTLWCVNDSK